MQKTAYERRSIDWSSDVCSSDLYAGGVLTWTTGGLMRSEFTCDQETYRHRDINTEYRPGNSFCVLQTDKNTSMILDERGIYRSQGEEIGRASCRERGCQKV